MTKYFFLIIVLLFLQDAKAQKNYKQIEIEPYIKLDKYPQFTNAINVISNYKLKINGTSWGFNSSYKTPLKKKFFLKVGIGYFKYAFNKIKSINQSFGEGKRRIINYPTTLSIVLGTDKYWYNTVCINLGIEKVFELKSDLQLNCGIRLLNYFTFSQHYHIPADNSFIPPALKIENNYKTTVNRYFGTGTELNLDLLKKIRKVSLGPSLIIPVYNSWKQDAIFPTETNSSNRSKWLGGIGIGLKCNYLISKTKKI